ncbi:MAG: hypothetical protein KDA92_01175 [Planctomycetales bacterium]|nr:hypothetical protein [Planctomycetales bacterium]
MSTPPQTTVDMRKTVTQYFLLTVLVWCALPLSPPNVDSDFWGHVQYGRDVWQHGLDRTATYTYNAIGHPWINHENLCELLFAAFVDSAGIGWLLALKCLLGVAIVGWAMHRANRQAVHPLITAAVAILAASNLSYYWGVRPHLFSFVFFGAMIGWTDWCFEGWQGSFTQLYEGRSPWRDDVASSRRWGLWLLVPLLTIWTNTHGGFLAGLAVILALLGSRAIHLLFSRTVPSDSGSARSLRRLAGYLFVLMAVIGLATLINPYGIGLHKWLAINLSRPRPEILEWHAPNLLSTAAWKLDVVLVLMGLSLIANWRQFDPARLLVTTVVAYEALTHARHIPFLMMLFMFWYPPHLQTLFSKLIKQLRPDGPSTSTSSATASPKAAMWADFACSLLSLYAVSLGFRVGTRLHEIPVYRDQYPVSAAQFIADHGLTGRVVTSGKWAQYTLCVLGARTPGDRGLLVAFDGRLRTCYPQEVVDLHFDFALGDGGPDERFRSPSSPPADPKRILEFNQPELLLLDRHESHAQQVLATVADHWVLLYQDELSQLWGRRSIFDDPTNERYFPADQRVAGNRPQTGYVQWPASPKRHRGRASLAKASGNKHRNVSSETLPVSQPSR